MYYKYDPSSRYTKYLEVYGWRTRTSMCYDVDLQIIIFCYLRKKSNTFFYQNIALYFKTI